MKCGKSEDNGERSFVYCVHKVFIEAERCSASEAFKQLHSHKQKTASTVSMRNRVGIRPLATRLSMSVSQSHERVFSSLCAS